MSKIIQDGWEQHGDGFVQGTKQLFRKGDLWKEGLSHMNGDETSFAARRLLHVGSAIGCQLGRPPAIPGKSHWTQIEKLRHTGVTGEALRLHVSMRTDMQWFPRNSTFRRRHCGDCQWQRAARPQQFLRHDMFVSARFESTRTVPISFTCWFLVPTNWQVHQ